MWYAMWEVKTKPHTSVWGNLKLALLFAWPFTLIVLFFIGIAVIMVSHRLPDVLATTSRILLMRQGQVVITLATELMTVANLTEEVAKL